MSRAAPALFALLRPGVRAFANRLAVYLVRLGVSPNAITLTSVAANGVVALLVAQGLFLAAAIVLYLGNALDLLDGAVARVGGRASDFGAFLDSVCDRYSELLVLLGLVLWYGARADVPGVAVTFLVTAGSIMVSYARARAEGLGLGGEVGLVQRPERIVLLGVGFLFAGEVLFWMLVLLAILTNVTALQRILHVRAQTKAGRVERRQ